MVNENTGRIREAKRPSGKTCQREEKRLKIKKKMNGVDKLFCWLAKFFCLPIVVCDLSLTNQLKL